MHSASSLAVLRKPGCHTNNWLPILGLPWGCTCHPTQQRRSLQAPQYLAPWQGILSCTFDHLRPLRIRSGRTSLRETSPTTVSLLARPPSTSSEGSVMFGNHSGPHSATVSSRGSVVPGKDQLVQSTQSANSRDPAAITLVAGCKAARNQFCTYSPLAPYPRSQASSPISESPPKPDPGLEPSSRHLQQKQRQPAEPAQHRSSLSWQRRDSGCRVTRKPETGPKTLGKCSLALSPRPQAPPIIPPPETLIRQGPPSPWPLPSPLLPTPAPSPHTMSCRAVGSFGLLGVQAIEFRVSCIMGIGG